MLNISIIYLLILLTGCEQKPQVRHYTEITIRIPDKPMAMSNAMPTANDTIKNKITWDLPNGWVEESGGPMRLTTFKLSSNPEAFDGSIVALPGGAGGLVANLKRWMGQINLNTTDAEFDQFMRSSKDGVYDFTKLQQGQSPYSKSLIAAMIDIDGTTVFVKLNGTLTIVKEYRAAFLSLVRSVRLK